MARKKKKKNRTRGPAARRAERHPRRYNLEMIRDFLDHLLLELRVQHYELNQTLRRFGFAGTLGEAANYAISPELTEKLNKYIEKYPCFLLARTVFYTEGATEQETAEVSKSVIRSKSDMRDQQIGHLEALKKLFQEALKCAQMPTGVAPDGSADQPTQVVKVTEYLEDGQEDED